MGVISWSRRFSCCLATSGLSSTPSSISLCVPQWISPPGYFSPSSRPASCATQCRVFVLHHHPFSFMFAFLALVLLPHGSRSRIYLALVKPGPRILARCTGCSRRNHSRFVHTFKYNSKICRILFSYASWSFVFLKCYYPFDSNDEVNIWMWM